MKEVKHSLGVIASSIQIVNHAREIAEELNEDIRLSLKGLHDAIPVGKDMERSGVEVIVSRGGTSHILRDNLRIPVLSIPLTSFDILTSVHKAASLGKRILLTTSRNKISRIEIFEKLFHIELEQGIYYDSDSLENVIFSAQNQGFEVIIGGTISVQFAKKYGLKGVELQTAKETVASMIEDAKSVARSRREEQEKSLRYRCIIDSTSEGIIAVDRDGFITTTNKTAREALKIADKDITGRHVTNYIPKAEILNVLETQRGVLNKLEKIDHDLFVGNHIPIMIGNEIAGGVSTFKDITNVMRAENEVRRSFAKGLMAKYSIADFVHKSPLVKEVINRALRFAESDYTILITGETGTGKEILAHSIHNLGQRKKGPFVSINCAALPDHLLESELFGYEEGAFTGARKGGKPGLFEIAHKGTIFLDEIGATPHSVQARLLRVLQEKEVMRIGGDRLIPIDVRVIAATNKNLNEEVQKGMIREDLFFRLKVLSVHIPPLRERSEDIPLIVQELINRSSRKHRTNPLTIPDPFVMKLMEYPWPGNVRQLENFIESLILLTGLEFSPRIFHQLHRELLEYRVAKEKPVATEATSLKDYLNLKSRESEAELIGKALEDANFCKSRAAKRLGISRTTLWRKLKEAEEPR